MRGLRSYILREEVLWDDGLRDGLWDTLEYFSFPIKVGSSLHTILIGVISTASKEKVRLGFWRTILSCSSWWWCSSSSCCCCCWGVFWNHNVERKSVEVNSSALSTSGSCCFFCVCVTIPVDDILSSFLVDDDLETQRWVRDQDFFFYFFYFV